MSEHKERKKKEDVWQLLFLKRCRTCQHPKYIHLLEQTDTHYILGACNEVVQGGFCNCNEWEPPDNLDYIELLAKKKGLISEDEENV